MVQQIQQEQQALVTEVLKDTQSQRREQNVFVSEVLKDIQSQRKEQNIFITEVLKDMQLQHKEQSMLTTEVLKEMKSERKEIQTYKMRLLGMEYQQMENHTVVKNTLTEIQKKQNRLIEICHRVPQKLTDEYGIGFLADWP